jgi:hypothetical protein
MNAMENVFTAVLGKRSIDVAKFTREGIHFSESIGEVGQTVSFVFCANANGIALELPVSGKVELVPDGCIVPVEFNVAQSSAIRTLFNVGENSSPEDIVRVLYKRSTATPDVVKTTQLFSMGVTAAVCLALVASISYFSSAKRNIVSAQAAFIATDALFLESSSSGLVEYLAESGAIKAGEVYAAIRTRSGRSVFLESSAAGMVQNAGAQTGRGIVKGSPLVYVSNPSDKLFVKAYVSTETAAKLPNSYGAEIEISKDTSTRTVTIDKIVAGDITRGSQFTDQAGNPLSEIVLPLSDFLGLVPGQRVQVRFINRAESVFGFPAPDVGQLLSDWTKGIGVSS